MGATDLRISDIHPDVTLDAIIEAVEDGWFGYVSVGYCVECGAETEGVEPDAEGYRCATCEADTVYGAGTLLFAHFPLIPAHMDVPALQGERGQLLEVGR